MVYLLLSSMLNHSRACQSGFSQAKVTVRFKMTIKCERAQVIKQVSNTIHQNHEALINTQEDSRLLLQRIVGVGVERVPGWEIHYKSSTYCIKCSCVDALQFSYNSRQYSAMDRNERDPVLRWLHIRAFNIFNKVRIENSFWWQELCRINALSILWAKRSRTICCYYFIAFSKKENFNFDGSSIIRHN